MAVSALASAFASLWQWLNKQPPAIPVTSKPSIPLPPIVPVVATPSLALPLRYLIANETQLEGKDNEIVEVGYDGPLPKRGIGIRYGNLLNQTKNDYSPYLKATDTADQYGEKVVDPKGAGWTKLLADQCHSAIAAGFHYIEWDNPDSYSQAAVLEAVGYAQIRTLQVIAKNPLSCSWDGVPYLAHKAVVGCVVERDAGSPADMDALRRKAGKPDLPVWFVAFRDGKEDGGSWASVTAMAAATFKNMWVTFSPDGEYTSAQDVPILRVVPATPLPDSTVKYGTEYLANWKAMAIRPERAAAVEAIARKLIGLKSRYQTVQVKTGVPWYVIAVLHQRESDADFDTYLGNGDSIHRPTRNVPKGRGPFASWEAGAIDALAYDGLDKITSWPIERIGYECEKFNGFGYRSHGVPSAYLWSFSNIYKGGKYVSDGVWSSSAQDAQCGTMPMLKAMASIDLTILLDATAPINPPKPMPPLGSPELHDLGSRLKRTIQAQSLKWFVDQNVVSIERMDRDGTPNNLGPNTFRDIKMVLDGDGKIIGGPWTGTTHPGKYWTEHPMASGGAFIIALGQQSCWSPGAYHNKTVWRQAEDSSIMGHRDPDCTYERQGPPIKHGDIGVHHHGGYNLPRLNISNAAAGCQVIEMEDAQQEFIDLTMKCPRYLANKAGYRLTATVLQAKDILP